MKNTMPKITPPLSWGDLAEIQAYFDANFDPSRFGDISDADLDEKESEALCDLVCQFEQGEPCPEIRYL